MDRIVHSELGIQPGGHANGGSTRTCILRKHNVPILDKNGPPGMGGRTLVICSDTKPRHHGSPYPHPDGSHAIRPHTHNLSEGEAHHLAPTTWPVELVLIANVAGKAQFLDMG